MYWAGWAGASGGECDGDGDPFATWDDLAEQAGEQGLDFPSSGVCRWIDLSPSTGPLTAPVPAAEPRPAEIESLECGGSAVGKSAAHAVSASLKWSPEGGALGLDIHRAFEDDTYPEDDPGPVPVSAAESLPAVDHAPLPTTGEPFGHEFNCFERGYDRLRVPPGARLVARPTDGLLDSYEAVLAVDDDRQALEHLRSQMDDADDNEGLYELTEKELVGGGDTWVLSGGVGGGGGVCEMWSSPGGKAVFITAHID